MGKQAITITIEKSILKKLHNIRGEQIKEDSKNVSLSAIISEILEENLQ
jgi:hypothetical protein